MSGTAPRFRYGSNWSMPHPVHNIRRIEPSLTNLFCPVLHLHSYMSDGMIPLENRRIDIQCLEAFKEVRVLK